MTGIGAAGVSRSFQAPEELREAISKIGVPKRLKAGQALFHRGDPVQGVFLVKSGTVRLSVEENYGTCWMVEPGAMLGLPATVRDTPYSLTATAIEETEVAFADHERARTILASNAKLCFQVVEMLSGELQWLRFNE